MTTDELRAKFENWWLRNGDPFDLHKVAAWQTWQAAHASRDAEVDALRKDAERWHAVRSCAGNVGVYEGTPTYDPGVELLLDEEADQAIDAAMR